MDSSAVSGRRVVEHHPCPTVIAEQNNEKLINDVQDVLDEQLAGLEGTSTLSTSIRSIYAP